MGAEKKTWLIDPHLVTKAQKIRGEIDRAFKLHGQALADLAQVFPDYILPKRR